MREPGYYWIKLGKDDPDWEPAGWNGMHWMILGTDCFEKPAEIGPRLASRELTDRARTVVETFERDEAQGYQSSTRTYALDMLRPVLTD